MSTLGDDAGWIRSTGGRVDGECLAAVAEARLPAWLRGGLRLGPRASGLGRRATGDSHGRPRRPQRQRLERTWTASPVPVSLPAAWVAPDGPLGPIYMAQLRKGEFRWMPLVPRASSAKSRRARASSDRPCASTRKVCASVICRVRASAAVRMSARIACFSAAVGGRLLFEGEDMVRSDLFVRGCDRADVPISAPSVAS